MASKEKKKGFHLYYVEWLDHCGHAYNMWRFYEEATDLFPSHIRSCGWLIKETKKYIILCSTLSVPEHGERQTFQRENLILKSDIIDMWKVRK